MAHAYIPDEIKKEETRGRKIKRKFARTEFLKIRISKEHKKLLKKIRKEVAGTNTSDADIVEASLTHYGMIYALEPGK